MGLNSAHWPRTTKLPVTSPRGPAEFTSAELEASIPFTPALRLDGDVGQALLEGIICRLDAVEIRTRRRRQDDRQRLFRTTSALLANLVVARRNRHNAAIFVGVPFEAERYTGGDLSVTVMRQIRDFLLAEKLVEGQRGYWSTERWDSETTVHRHSRTTRLRATQRLLFWVEQAGINLAALPKAPDYGVRRERETGLIVMRDDGFTPGPEPVEVRASRAIISETNRLIAAASIDLSANAWALLAQDAKHDAGEEEEFARILAGDLSAVSLYRKFAGSWSAGGRLYGAFWQNHKKRYRRMLTINAEPTIELDYGRLHPTLLYAQAGLTLDFDPYLPAGFDLALRDLGKATFGRLLNSKTVVRASALSRPAKAPEGLSLADFRHFSQALIDLNRPISCAFGTDASVRLQHLDSEILLKVLGRMNDLGIVALPVHDSVIVSERHAEQLRQAMASAYSDVTGFPSIIINKA